MTSTQRDLLVAAPERWDEACFMVPAVRALMASGLGVGVICRDEQREFWKSVGGLEILAFPGKASAWCSARKLGSEWQASLVWEAGFAADCVYRARIQRRLGPAEGNLEKRLTHPLSFNQGPFDHRVRFYLGAVEEMGIFTAKPEFFAPMSKSSWDEKERNWIWICPDSDFGPSHEWLLSSWSEMMGKLLESRGHFKIVGLPGGRKLSQALAAEFGNRCDFITISSLAEVLPELRDCALLVAADGSLPHLASHAGATCVTLFGPNDPIWKRPLGKRHAVVRRHVECAPCLLAKCSMDGRCQNELESARVWQVVSDLISESA